MTDPAEQLRRVLAFEQQKNCSNTAVIGGLDAYLQHFAQDTRIPGSHRFSQILQALPMGGYGALHPVQRKRVVEELLIAVQQGLPKRAMPSPVSSKPSPNANRSDALQPVRSVPSSTAPANISLESHVTALPEVSKSAATKLSRLRIRTIGDLIYQFPVRYDDYSAVQPIATLRPGDHRTIVGEVISSGVTVLGRRREVTEAHVSDPSGTIRVIWWSGRWMARRVKPGMRLALAGKLTAFRGSLQMENPELEPLDDEALHSNRLVPVYRSTEGLDQRDLRSLVQIALKAVGETLNDALPSAMRNRLGLPGALDALRQVHAPDSQSYADAARNRFAFQELLTIELGVVKRQRERQAAGGARRLESPESVATGFTKSLAFALTGDQQKAIVDIRADIATEVAMNRLLEGDVGSGKTVIALAALLAAVANGFQGAIMAPTEILAEQHFRTVRRLLAPETDDPDSLFREIGSGYVVLRPRYMERPVRVALLRGGLKSSEKADAQVSIGRGDVDIAIGTQALIQRDVTFGNLALVVIDEQHRFGVDQRAALREKGANPHVLVMTATPIPRTLQLTIYGDLDITVLRDMPPGRPEVKTHHATPRQRKSAYEFVRKKVGEGRQAYVICPLVEESEAIEAKAAVQEYERLSKLVFPDLRLGLLHGRLSPGDKDAVMRAFRDGGLDILVSTAVVEVGIDVPNATIMLIEGAERFGLTQLHQFRGRVRRSETQAYCLLLSESATPEALERLQITVNTSDGFKLAEEDLRLRGAGEYFGTRQSGMPGLRFACLTDVRLIEQARTEAGHLLDADPELARPEHALLAAQVDNMWNRVSAEAT